MYKLLQIKSASINFSQQTKHKRYYSVWLSG